jgi:hypothetical protein
MKGWKKLRLKVEANDKKKKQRRGTRGGKENS